MTNTHITLPALLACLLAFAAGDLGRGGHPPASAKLAPASLSAPPPAVAGRPPAAGLCTADEQVVFSCALRGTAKLVSLCGSKTLTRDAGYIQYRSGRPGRLELEFPKDRAGSQKLFSYEHEFRARFDRTEIGFENGGFSYTLFDYYNGEEKPASREAGVRVRASGENAKEITMRCAGRVTARYGDLTEILTSQQR